MRRVGLVAVAVALAAVARPASAQVAASSAGSSAADSLLNRIQQLAEEGNVVAGRSLADSAIAKLPEGAPQYVEALYWRARMAASVDQARRDFMRIAIEFSLAPRAEDALLRLAQLEYTRGDHDAAKRYLDRLSLQFANGPAHAQASFLMARVLLDEGSLPQACAYLSDAKARASQHEVELVNQVSYYARPCQAVVRAADSLRADSAARADSLARADSTARAAANASKARTAAATAPKREGKPGKAAPAGPEWTVQVAAYAQKEEADRLAKRLGARGYDARVTPERPYRVRIGRFGARDAAQAVAQKLKAAQTPAIVVEAEKP